MLLGESIHCQEHNLSLSLKSDGRSIRMRSINNHPSRLIEMALLKMPIIILFTRRRGIKHLNIALAAMGSYNYFFISKVSQIGI